MGFFDDTINKAKDAIDTVGKKTNDIVAVQKLKSNARQLSSKIEEAYASLGRLCFDGVSACEEKPEGAAELVEEITTMNEQLEELKKEIAKAQGGVVCPSCGSVSPEGSCFCNKCGEKF